MKIHYNVDAGPEAVDIVNNVDLSDLVKQLHGVSVSYSANMVENVECLAALRSSEYLLLLDEQGAFLTEAAHAYREGTDAHNRFIGAADSKNIHAFAIHVTNVWEVCESEESKPGRIFGDVVCVEIAALQQDIQQNSITPKIIDGQRSFDLSDHTAIRVHLERVFEQHKSTDILPMEPDEFVEKHTTPKLSPIRLYIENTNDSTIGGFTIPLPTTSEALRSFFEDAEISSIHDMEILDIRSDVIGLGNILMDHVEMNLSTFNELNYLAAKISTLDPNDRDIFDAVIEAKRHCWSIPEIINITENVNTFDVMPTFSAGLYGGFLIDMAMDEHAEVFNRLEASADPAERAFAKYIELLEKHVDHHAYGRTAAEKENGSFTDKGYLTADEDAFKRVYPGPQDIPPEYCLTQAFDLKHVNVMVKDVDLSVMMAEIHAAGGDYMRDLKRNMYLLSNVDNLFLMTNSEMPIVAPADSLFHKDNITEQHVWLMADVQDTRTFMLHVNDREDGRPIGSIYEADLASLQESIRKNSISFSYLDAEMNDGTSKIISHAEWCAMDTADRSQVKSYVRHYDPIDKAGLAAIINALPYACESNCQQTAANDFLAKLNEPYMAQAANPQPGMLRITQEAAREILAQNSAEVYRLTQNGPEQLKPIDAAKHGLWFSVDREFAVKKQDLPAIEKWAQRNSEEMLRQIERGEHRKSRGDEAL